MEGFQHTYFNILTVTVSGSGFSIAVESTEESLASKYLEYLKILIFSLFLIET